MSDFKDLMGQIRSLFTNSEFMRELYALVRKYSGKQPLPTDEEFNGYSTDNRRSWYTSRGLTTRQANLLLRANKTPRWTHAADMIQLLEIRNMGEDNADVIIAARKNW